MHPYLNKKVGSVFSVPKVAGEYGIELEIEGENLPNAIPGWYAKKEDSLRGEALEYVTDGACSMGDLRASMDRLHDKLSVPTTKVSLSKRASTHIHLNMQKETFHTVLGFITLWVIVEPVTLRLCGPLRNGNLFCMSSIETGDLPWWMERVSANLTGPYAFSSFPQRGKYATLNTDPLKSFGSVEARCFPISITPEEVCKWAQWMGNMKQIVKDWPDKSFKSLVDYAYNEPNALIASVFTDQPNVFTACHPSNPYDLVHAGVEIAWEMVKSAEPVLLYDETQPKAKQRTKRTLFDVHPDQIFDDMPTAATASTSDWTIITETPPDLLSFTEAE